MEEGLLRPLKKDESRSAKRAGLSRQNRLAQHPGAETHHVRLHIPPEKVSIFAWDGLRTTHEELLSLAFFPWWHSLVVDLVTEKAKNPWVKSLSIFPLQFQLVGGPNDRRISHAGCGDPRYVCRLIGKSGRCRAVGCIW